MLTFISELFFISAPQAQLLWVRVKWKPEPAQGREREKVREAEKGLTLDLKCRAIFLD